MSKACVTGPLRRSHPSLNKDGVMECGWPRLFPRATTPVLQPYRVSDHGKLPRAPILRPVIRMSRMALT